MLPVSIVTTALLCAVLLRRWAPVRDRVAVATSTILAVLGAVVLGTVLAQSIDGGARWLAVPAAAVASALVALAGAWVNEHILAPLRRRRADAGPGPARRLEQWAEARPEGWDGGIVAVGVRAWRRAVDVRVTGLAAEMSYYGLISLVPLAIALGSGLGYLGRVVGEEQVARIEEVLVDAVAGVFAEQVTDDVLAPLIEGLLHEERAGFAIGSVVVTLWLASRMFRAAVRALEDAYRVPRRRGIVGQYVLGLAFALGALVTLVVLLTTVVVGPLFGTGKEIAAQLGLGPVFDFAWSVVRWPVVAAITGAYLTILYRYGPNVATTWTRCLPGAALGTAGLVLVALGFSVYLGLVGLAAPGAASAQSDAVTGAAQAIGIVLAGVVWLWLSGIVLVLGGILNAELDPSARPPAVAHQPVAP